MKSIRAICFDLDNTLWDVWPVIRRAEQAVYDFLAQRYPKAVANMSIEAMRDARVKIALDYPHMAHDFSFLRRQQLLEQAAACGYEPSMSEEAFEVFIAARNEVELYADVPAALEVLHRHYRLFTASNGNADLRRIGLGHLFERTIAARDVGALKPDPAVFRKVLEGTDLQAEEVLFVGDDPELDVEGARQVGMQPVWVNRTQAIWPEHLELPLHSVTSLTDLVALLGVGAQTTANTHC
jgi:FMN hydrolase / 5-amino-6-(5-phospho-D-ribitylamino)uracil phosphatase